MDTDPERGGAGVVVAAGEAEDVGVLVFDEHVERARCSPRDVGGVGEVVGAGGEGEKEEHLARSTALGSRLDVRAGGAIHLGHSDSKSQYVYRFFGKAPLGDASYLGNYGSYHQKLNGFGHGAPPRAQIR